MNADLASALRDIMLPPAAPLWPPAPGWWLAAALVIPAVIWGLTRGPPWWRRARRRRLALRVLRQIRRQYREHGCAHQTFAETSALLKRAALGRFPPAQVAGLSGEAWLNFLDTCWRNGGHALFIRDGRALIDAPYRRDTQADVEPVLRLSAAWLRGSL